jgi:hypothetical protein
VALPYELRQEFLKGNVVLFVGAGFVKNYLPTMPLWQDLLRQVFSTLSGDTNEIFKYCDAVFDQRRNRIVHPAEYLRLAQQFELARERVNRGTPAGDPSQVPGIHELIQRALTENYSPEIARHSVVGSHFAAAKRLPLPIWVTTNFDTFLEDTFFDDGINTGTDIVLSRPIRNVDFAAASGGGRTLLKIHGSVSNPEPEQSIVITEEDYHRFLRSDRYIINKLYTLFCERTVVFLGYSLSDPNIQFIYHEVLFDQKAGGSPGDSHSFSQIRPSFFLSRTAIPPEQKAYYKHKRIHYVENCSIEEYFEQLGSTFETFERGRADIIARITANLGTYTRWYELITWNTDPAALTVEDDQKVDSLAQMLDLVELHEAVYRASASAVTMQEFEPAVLNLVVQGILTVAERWCDEFLSRGRTDLLEMLLDFLKYKQRVRKSSVLHSLLNAISRWLDSFPGLPDIDRFVQKYCALIQQYDAAYNDWGDYTYCLDHYVIATRLFAHMSNPTRRRIAEGLYRQLSMCGRDVGDSWYTTNRVYQVWPQFHPAAWPLLEAEIRKYGTGNKNEAMLDFLRPGGDCTSFLPRQ